MGFNVYIGNVSLNYVSGLGRWLGWQWEWEWMGGLLLGVVEPQWDKCQWGPSCENVSTCNGEWVVIKIRTLFQANGVWWLWSIHGKNVSQQKELRCWRGQRTDGLGQLLVATQGKSAISIGLVSRGVISDLLQPRSRLLTELRQH